MKAAQDKMKSCADRNKVDRDFAVGDKVFLKIKLLKVISHSWVKCKLSLRYVVPFDNLNRVGDYAYRRAHPLEYICMHNVFHISLLRWYGPDKTHVIDFELLEICPDMTYEEHPVKNYMKEFHLRNKVVHLMKVQWKHHGLEVVTWELRDEI